MFFLGNWIYSWMFNGPFSEVHQRYASHRAPGHFRHELLGLHPGWDRTLVRYHQSGNCLTVKDKSVSHSCCYTIFGDLLETWKQCVCHQFNLKSINAVNCLLKIELVIQEKLVFVLKIACGIAQKRYAFLNISQKSYTTVKYAVKTMAALSDCIIFLFLGVVTVRFKHEWHTGFALWTLGLCTVAR